MFILNFSFFIIEEVKCLVIFIEVVYGDIIGFVGLKMDNPEDRIGRIVISLGVMLIFVPKRLGMKLFY